MTDKQFIDKIQKDNIYFNHFSNKLTNSKFDADDLLQDASIKAYQNLDGLEETQKFKTWFSSIIYRTFLNKKEKQKRRRNLLKTQGSYQTFFFNRQTTHNTGLERLKAEDILAAKNNIKPKMFRAFWMRFMGYSYKEIATQLSISIGTVKSRISSTRNKLREGLC